MDYSKLKTILDERHSPLPVATGFSLTYPMKDNKQVTKLTKLGGKVDRESKRVVFKFNTVAARTKFRKKNKELLSTITEAKTKTRTFEFPDNRKAKQFAKDMSNSGIATTKLVDSIKVQVQMLPGSKSVINSGLAKYLKANRGKESVTEEISPAQAKKMGIDMPLSGKGYPYNESRPKTVGENMKTYKDFKNTISEQGEYTPSGMKHTGRDARDSNVPLHDLGNPEALGAVNAFIEQYTTQEYMNPRQAVSQLRARLNTCGLHFDFQANGTVAEGIEEYPLTLFGGRSGWDMEKGGVSEDDGITPKLGYGLSMQIEYTVAESGLYRIGAKIVKQAETKGQ
jgi:hypothetical protein